MSGLRLVPWFALVVVACASWEGPEPTPSPPPNGDGVSPSHYAPPPPGDPRATPPTDTPASSVKVAIASVQLIEDCADPVAAPAAGAMAPSAARSMQKPTVSSQAGDSAIPGATWQQPCTQSMVQLAISGELRGPGVFKIEAVRVLDAASQKVAGPAKLRGPTEWTDGAGYAPWDERVRTKTEQKVSYKLGNPDLSRASETVGPGFTAWAGPFVLELEVSIDGARQTIRSSEFSQEPPHMVVT